VPRSIRRVEIYLPLEYNDGRRIEEAKYKRLHSELRARFGGVTSTQSQFPLKGVWKSGSELYEERVVVFTMLDFRDQTESRLARYLERLKARLEERFEQEEILITVQELRAI
jgi:hypothetical protein